MKGKIMLTRESIIKDYNVYNGAIQNPGKYEGEPIFAPYFFELAGEGCADEEFEHEGTSYWVFFPSQDDFTEFPELDNAEVIVQSESDDGFVYTSLMSRAEFDNVFPL